MAGGRRPGLFWSGRRRDTEPAGSLQAPKARRPRPQCCLRARNNSQAGAPALRPQIGRYRRAPPAARASAPNPLPGAHEARGHPQRHTPTLFSCRQDRKWHSQLNKTDVCEGRRDHAGGEMVEAVGLRPSCWRGHPEHGQGTNRLGLRVARGGLLPTLPLGLSRFAGGGGDGAGLLRRLALPSSTAAC